MMLQHDLKGRVRMRKKSLDNTMGNQQPSVCRKACEGSTTIETSVQYGVDAYDKQLHMRTGSKKRISKETIQELYLEKKMSTVDISKMFHMSRNTLRQIMKEYNIQTRSAADGGRIKSQKYNYRKDLFLGKTVEDAYYIGFLMADGHITENRKVGCFSLEMSALGTIKEIGSLLYSDNSEYKLERKYKVFSLLDDIV
jgi:hypothetical protein